MRYKDLFEIYSDDNKYLRDYLKSDDFDPYSNWWAICDAIFENEDWHEAMMEVLNKDITEDELNEEEPEIFYKLPKDIQTDIAKQVIEYVMQHDPADAPTTAHLSLQKNQLIRRQTWLIHFTDDANSVAESGFTKGIDQMDKLGLTTYLKKHNAGYNFAFEADSRYARNAASEGKYGKHAVMFQNSGVHVWHYSDEEAQVIFWGADVKPRDIIELYHTDDWHVMSKYSDRRTGTQRRLFSGDFADAVQWVMQNFPQYRKALTGF